MNKSIIFSVLSAVIVITISVLVTMIKLKNKEIKELGIQIEKLNKTKSISEELYNNASALADSAIERNTILATHEPLTLSMIYRDSIRKLLKYKIGEIVFLKPDSSKAVIKDILVGGGKYEYYMKYQIVRKDYTSDIVTPEMVY